MVNLYATRDIRNMPKKSLVTIIAYGRLQTVSLTLQCLLTWKCKKHITVRNQPNSWKNAMHKLYISVIYQRKLLNVTWMKTGFNAYQKHRSMHPSIFNRFPVIQPVSSKVRHFSTFLHILASLGTPL